MAIYLKDAPDLRLNKTPFYLPLNMKNKRKNSAIFLLSPDIKSSIKLMNHPLTISKGLFESYYIEKDINFVINESNHIEEDNSSTILETYLMEMTKKERDAIPESKFGLEEERKYPLDSAEHVRSAIKLFGHCPENRKHHLAKRIMAAAKKHGVEVKETTEVYKYANSKVVNEGIGTVTFYHTAIDRITDKKVKPLGVNYGNRLEKAKWSVFMWRERKYANPWGMYLMTRRVLKKIDPEGVMYTDLPWLSSNVIKGEYKLLIREDYWDILKKATLGKKFWVYSVESTIGNFGVGHSSYFPEWTSYKEVPITKEEEITITSKLFDQICVKCTKEQYDHFSGLNKTAHNRSLLNFLFYEPDDFFRTVKDVRKKIKNGEIKPGEGDLQTIIDGMPVREAFASFNESFTEEPPLFNPSIARHNEDIITESGFDFQNETNTYRTIFGDTANEMILNEGYSQQLRKMLFNERIKNQKEAILVYDKIKKDCPFIKYTYLNYRLYKEKNLFIDWAYYTENFFKHLKWERDKGVQLYYQFFTKFLKDKRINENNYTVKTVFVPVTDWNDGKNPVWDYTKTINPISVIYRIFRTKTEAVLKEEWKGLRFVFFSDKAYFTLTFDNITMANMPKFISLINKLCNDDVADAEFETKDSASVITHKVIDKIENSGIVIDDISGGAGDFSKDELNKMREKEMNSNDRGIAAIMQAANGKTSKDQVDKALLVQKIQKAAEESSDENDALSNMNDDEKDSAWMKNLILDLQEEEGPNISKARTERMKTGYQDFLRKKIDKTTVEELLEVNEGKKELPKENIPIDNINEEWKDVQFSTFSREYNIEADIMKSLADLNDKSIPVIVTEVDKEDASTTEDYIETWTIKLEDINGKRFTMKIDVPKFINNRFMKLRGNYKTINGQLLLLPIIKTDEDTAQIVSNYNKIFIRRVSPSNGTKTSAQVSRICKFLRTYKGKSIEIIEGDNKFVSSKYSLNIEYADLSYNYSKIKFKDGSYISFNQDELRKKWKEKEGYTPYFVDSKGNIHDYSSDISPASQIATIIREHLTEEEKKDFDSIKPDKRLSYTEASILATDIPVIVVMAYSVGLQEAMRKAGIEYEFSEKRPSKTELEGKDYIKFNDGYLIYKNTLENSLLMNGLYSCNTEDYSIKEINKKNMWLDFLDNFGGRIKADGLDNFYDCMFDPITKEICRTYNLPDDYITALGYASALLADTNYNKHTDISGNRFRTNEIIAAYFQKVISKAYGEYKTMSKRSKKDAVISCKQSALIDALLTDPTCSDLSILNPQLEAEEQNTMSFKGLSGMNSDRSYSLDKRTYDDSMFGIIGTSTGFSGNVGITRQATINASIKGVRGVISTPKKDKINTLNTLTVHEAMNPWCTTRDDPIRVAMGFVQSTKHPMRIKKAMPNLVTTGMDEAIPYITSDFFSYKFRGNKGKVLKLTDRYMLVQDVETGAVDFVSLEEQTMKNSDGGFYVTVKLDPIVKEGATLKNNDILAVDRTCYKDQVGHESTTKGVTYCIGALCKLAILPTDEGYEDSSIIDEYLADVMTSSYVVKKDKMLSKDANVYNVVSKGQPIKEGDPLMIFQNAFEEEDANSILRNVTDADIEDVTDLGRIHIRSKISGIVQDIKIYRTCELSEMSPSLRKLVSAYEKQIKDDKKIFDKYKIEGANWKLEPDYKLEPTGKLKKCPNSVLIEFYIKCEDKMGIGDKLIYNNSIKGVIKDIMPPGTEPRTEFRPNEPINALLSTGSVNARMVASIIINGSINKCMIELSRKCKELLGIPWKNLPDM